jgi:hypothetical protein
MKKLLFLVFILITGLFVYILYFAESALPSAVILPPLAIYLLSISILFMIIKKGFDFMVSR